MSRYWRSSVALIAVLLALTGAASALGAADAASKDNESILDLQFDLGLWTIVVFVLLFLVLRRYAWGPILQGLQRREQSIHDAIAQAQQARDEAQKLREQIQAQLDQTHLKVRDILEGGRKDTERTTQEMIAKARSEIQSERDRLRREIETARDQAVQELWKQTANLATMISAKAIRRELSPDDHRRLMDETLSELSQAGTRRQQPI
jgi:F-type H+-transporting ATPase subunit b